MNKQAQLIEQLNKQAAEYKQARERFDAWQAAYKKTRIAKRVVYPTKEADEAFIQAYHKLMNEHTMAIASLMRPHQRVYEAAKPKLKADAYERYNALTVPVNAMLHNYEGLTQERIERVVAEFGEGVKTLIAESTQSD